MNDDDKDELKMFCRVMIHLWNTSWRFRTGVAAILFGGFAFSLWRQIDPDPMLRIIGLLFIAAAIFYLLPRYGDND